MAKEDEKKETGEWKEFFWNPRTHELLGRTASSWGECPPVCMMIQPKTDLLEIVYNVEKTENWDSYVQALDNFLAPYNDSQQVMKNDACVPDQYFTQEDSGEVRNNPKRSCQFNRTVLEECSGLSDHTYGYQDGKPCVLIKLNRVTGQSQNDFLSNFFLTIQYLNHTSDFFSNNSAFISHNSDLFFSQFRLFSHNSAFMSHNSAFISFISDFPQNFAFISHNSHFFL
uniref:Sodium/potassium-transporting ATPase subunit beta-2 n=1 Tax=Sinocyclocheilus anshuiensis TaxID=1608454 RepID=A0A671N555_9TELE